MLYSKTMNMISVLTLLLVIGNPVMSQKPDRFSSCLPDTVDLKAVVQEEPVDTKTEAKPKTRTVEQKLLALDARCRNGKLVDKAGKEISFVQLLGCWGNPPEDYQEQLDRQQQEIKRLKEKHTVIEISCAQDPSKIH